MPRIVAVLDRLKQRDVTQVGIGACPVATCSFRYCSAGSWLGVDGRVPRTLVCQGGRLLLLYALDLQAVTFQPPYAHPHALFGSLPPFSLLQHQDYTYYGLASPWLQVKCLRVLQYFPPPEEPSVRRTLVDVVKRILGGALHSLGLFVVLLLPVVLHGVHALDVRIGRSVWRP